MGFGTDDRKSFRATIVEPSEGTLFIGDSAVPVRLLDQSATGFKLSAEPWRPIVMGVEALLDVNDGVQHTVEIVRVEPADDHQILGLKLRQTRLRPPIESAGVVKSRRLTVKATVALFVIVVAFTFAIQAAPVRNRISDLALFQFLNRHEKPTKSDDVEPKRRPVQKIDRARPFDVQRYLATENADWLKLAEAQRSLLRGLLDVCGGNADNRIAPAQRAYVEFAAKGSAFELMNTEQRSLLEQEADRPLSGTALLREVLKSYSAQANHEELASQFGSLIFASPEIADKYGVPPSVTAAICKQLDEAFELSKTGKRPAQDGLNPQDLILDFTLRMQKLEADCRKQLLPASTKLEK